MSEKLARTWAGEPVPAPGDEAYGEPATSLAGGRLSTADLFRQLAGRAKSIASELEQMRERVALTEQVDRHALSGAIGDANGCRTWCEFLERRAREAGDPR